MSTADFNLKTFEQVGLPTADELRGLRFAVVYAEWNSEITFALADGARTAFHENGVSEDNIDYFVVPGAFELSYAAARLWKTGKYAAVVVIGCVVRGDTPHFDYICQGVSTGVTAVNLQADCPIIFSVLTTNTMEQARERAGGRLGNKGYEGAISALKMVKTFGGVK